VTSIILRTAARALQPVLLLYAVFLLAVGHNEPGGGFVAGLVVAAGAALYLIAYDAASLRRVLPVDPRTLIGVGLLLALGSGVWSLTSGEPFMTGQWGHIARTLPVGTPLLFDLGVSVLVTGAALLMIVSLAED
jgi:multisubunit Na+/H+ antiporter MnhB subunit